MSTATHNTTYQANSQDKNVKEAVHSVASNWGWLLAAGGFSVFAGLVAIGSPILATGVTVMVLAATVIAAGIVNMSALCFADTTSSKVDNTLVGLAQVLFGAVMLAYPLATVVSLTIVVASFMLAAGFVRAGLAVAARGFPGWGWQLAGGLATMAVGLIALTGMPGTALWVIGILVGVEMLSSGVSRIAAAWQLREIAKATAE